MDIQLKTNKDNLPPYIFQKLGSVMNYIGVTSNDLVVELHEDKIIAYINRHRDKFFLY